MGQKSSQLVKVEGSVSPGFESVKEMFEKNFRRGAEDSAQLCVYVGEEKVLFEVLILMVVIKFGGRLSISGAQSRSPSTRVTP